MKLSIIIPVFNEEKTIISVLESVINVIIPGFEKEIVIVNDGSQDNTDKAIKLYLKKNKKSILYLSQRKNLGKGAAVSIGLAEATGDYVVIQDADLEYSPKDLIKIAKEIKNNKKDIIFGTRLHRLPHFTKEENTPYFLVHYIGNRFLSLITSLLYGQWITDMETCYKMFPRSAVENMRLRARGFEFEPEITAKFLKLGYRIKEVPITTTPRNYKEGKKLYALKDGPIAFWTLLKYRFTN